VTGEMIISKARISVDRYAAFREWLLKVDQSFSRKLTAQAGGRTASRD